MDFVGQHQTATFWTPRPASTSSPPAARSISTMPDAIVRGSLPRQFARAVFDLQEQTMADDPIGEAHAHIREAISELRAKNIEVPISLYRAAHALAHAAAAESFPAASRASHFS
jgi:hypothetical protein